MCIDVPEWRTNSRSSGSRFNANKHQFLESEKNVALSCSANFNILWASFHAASRAPCSLPLCLILRLILKFWDVGVALMRFSWANQSSEGFWSRMSAWRATAFVKIGSASVCLSSSVNRWRFRRLHFLEDTPQLSCIWWVNINNNSPCSAMLLILLQHSYCTLGIILFGLFAKAVHHPYDVHKSTLLQTDNHSWSCRNKHSGGCHFSQN